MLLVDLQILLRGFELIQKTVFEDIYFVGVELNPLVYGAIAVVADLDGTGAADLALNAEIPRFGVGLRDVRIYSIRAD